MPWGEPRVPDLAESVRGYIQNPTAENFERLKRALEMYDQWGE